MNARFALSGVVSMMGFAWLTQSCTPTWDPGAEMDWPLVGLHKEVACEGCHTDGLGPLPTACEQCHEQDRPGSHYAGPCGTCHTPLGWQFAVVDHSFFPLEDAHELECTSCHEEGDFSGLDPACASCHEPDRPTLDDPTPSDPDLVADHLDGHRSWDCGDCHVPTTWGDRDVFNHDRLFPTPHGEGVSSCGSCHLDGSDLSTTFSCTDCHEHSRSETDDDHDEVSGYSYSSEACFRCHPNGDD
jgi:hypothetical protein